MFIVNARDPEESLIHCRGWECQRTMIRRNLGTSVADATSNLRPKTAQRMTDAQSHHLVGSVIAGDPARGRDDEIGTLKGRLGREARITTDGNPGREISLEGIDPSGTQVSAKTGLFLVRN